MTERWLVGARVVDGTGRDPVEGLDIRVEDGRIAELGHAPAGADVVDLTGCTLTPGLIDAHVHLGLASPLGDLLSNRLSVAEIAADIFNNAAQTLDAGYTTVRDTGGIDGGLPHAIASGKVRGPRVLQCGPIQCQTGGHGHLANEWEPTSLWDTHHIPGLCSMAFLSDGTEQMRKNVRETFRRGADFIKLCVTGGVVSTHDALTDTQFTREEIAVAVEEANARGTYVTVHAHNNAGVRNAVEAGVKCVEHGSAINEEVAALMASEGVAHVPTLAVVEQLLRSTDAVGLPPAIRDRALSMRQGQLDALAATRAAGVKVGLGSDLIGPDQTGRSEELLIRAELETSMDALVAATRTNSQVLRIDHLVGTIEVGKMADLVAWSSDPLESPKVFTDRNQAAVIFQAGATVKDLR
ncbi:MAG TPA: amidohydrolase family protein [Mycobacteriales bacterium]|nr:amidohydrolase family protein [Mycobacteriales bacterium]